MTSQAGVQPVDLRRALKPADAWWTALVVDPVLMRVLPYCLRARRLTPNVVTTAAFVVGVIAVGAFATGHLRVGALIIEARFVLDCLDGKIARIRRLSSPAGALFDRAADAVTIPAAFAALGWSLAARTDVDPRWAMLPALASCVLIMTGLMLDLTRATRDVPAIMPMAAAAPAALQPIVRFARSRRLVLTPTTVEAEVIGLFLGPLLFAGRALLWAEAAALAVYLLLFVRDIALLVVENRTEAGA